MPPRRTKPPHLDRATLLTRTERVLGPNLTPGWRAEVERELAVFEGCTVPPRWPAEGQLAAVARDPLHAALLYHRMMRRLGVQEVRPPSDDTLELYERAWALQYHRLLDAREVAREILRAEFRARGVVWREPTPPAEEREEEGLEGEELEEEKGDEEDDAGDF
ncbi:hypothetical protein Q8F55_005648 [Vanrija albida]|uniref:Uncharacterized protein n=1 Tax=Vanrija albida TaxID=181172 RepID=A0ABR3Q275_9TREE